MLNKHVKNALRIVRSVWVQHSVPDVRRDDTGILRVAVWRPVLRAITRKKESALNVKRGVPVASVSQYVRSVKMVLTCMKVTVTQVVQPILTSPVAFV